MSNLRSERSIEAQATRASVSANISAKDRKIFGTSDWFICCTTRGTLKLMREQDMATDTKIVGMLAGPYTTRSQAKDETYGYRPEDNNTEFVCRVWAEGGYVELK